MPDLNLAIIISAIDKLTGPSKKMKGSMDDLVKSALKVAEAGTKIRDMGDNLNRSAILVGDRAARMRGFITDLLTPVAAIEDAAAKIRSLPGETAEGVNKAVEAARGWSKLHVDKPAQYLQTLYEMKSAGFEGANALMATEAALRVSTATMGEASATGKMLAIAYNNLGDKARPFREEFTRIADIMTQTQQVFQLSNMNDLVEGMRYAQPVAIQCGMAIDQVAAVIGQLNREGLNASMAGTGFQASMSKMVEASQKLRFEIAQNEQGGVDFIGTLENIVAKFGPLTELSQKQQLAFQHAFGGPEALKAVVMLSKDIDILKRDYQGLTNSAGAAARAQAIMEASPGKRYEIFKNKIEELRVSVGSKLLPMLLDLMPTIEKVVDKLTSFADAHPGIVKVAGALALIATAALSVAAPIMGVAGSLMNVVGWGMQIGGMTTAALAPLGGLAGAFRVLRATVMATSSAFLTNPIGWICLAIGAAAFVVYKYWKPIGAFFEKLFPGIGSAAKRWWPEIVAAISYPLLPMLAPLIFAGVLIYRNWAPIKAWFLDMWAKIGPAIQPVLDILKKLFVTGPIAAGIWYLMRLRENWRITFNWIGAHAREIAAIVNFSWAVIKGWFEWSPMGLVARGWGAAFDYLSAHARECAAVMNFSLAVARRLWEWTPLGAVIAHWEPIKAFFEGLFEAIKAIFKRLQPVLMPILAVIGLAIQAALGPILELKKALGPLWEQFVSYWSQKGPATALLAATAAGPALPMPAMPAGPAGAEMPVSAPAIPGGGIGGGPISVEQSYQIIIQTQPGQDVKAIAEAVIKELKAKNAQAAREALHDAL